MNMINRKVMLNTIIMPLFVINNLFKDKLMITKSSKRI
jgi:hypothetical protein